MVKNLPDNARDIRDTGSIPELGRSPGGGHGNPLQYSCLENLMDRRAWEAAVHWVTKSWTQLMWLSTHANTSTCIYQCFHFFMWIWVILWFPFILAWGIPFRISRRADLLGTLFLFIWTPWFFHFWGLAWLDTAFLVDSLSESALWICQPSGLCGFRWESAKLISLRILRL